MSFEIRFWSKYPVAIAICIQINLSICCDLIFASEKKNKPDFMNLSITHL